MINTALLKIGAGTTALLAGGAVALLSPSSPAVAYSSPPLFLDVSIQSPAHLVARGAAVTIPITTTCSGSQAYLSVQITERVGKKVASGSTFLTVGCTGSRQQLAVTVPASSSTVFSKGTAYVTASLTGCTYSFCGEENNSATIQVAS
jgi:hypothetical protein